MHENLRSTMATVLTTTSLLPSCYHHCYYRAATATTTLVLVVIVICLLLLLCPCLSLSWAPDGVIASCLALLPLQTLHLVDSLMEVNRHAPALHLRGLDPTPGSASSSRAPRHPVHILLASSIWGRCHPNERSQQSVSSLWKDYLPGLIAPPLGSSTRRH
jgi:hypothetical protein